jgi:SSS family solute:Na+ symporter
MGGLKAVVFTDVLQTFIMLAGAILSLCLITANLGEIAAWWPTEWRTEWVPLNLFDTKARISEGSAVLTGFTYFLCTACSDQMAVQRYLATRDANAARRMFGISLICGVFVSLLLGALGFALFSYFTAHPEMLPHGETVASGADRLLPHYIVAVLPSGVAGLVVAGILSAAMDSLSSGLNSTCSVVVADWIERFHPSPLRGTGEVRQAKVITWLIGILVVVLSLFAVHVPGNLFEMCYRAVSVLVPPLAVLFLMAMFIPWATVIGTWAAALASTIVSVRIAYWEDLFWPDHPLSVMWILPLSLLAGMAVGCLVSLAPIGQRRAMLGCEQLIERTH